MDKDLIKLMKSEKKILKVLQMIQEKIDISPVNSVIDYRAGLERTGLNVQDEVMILNKLAEDGFITVINNFGSESI